PFSAVFRSSIGAGVVADSIVFVQSKNGILARVSKRVKEGHIALHAVLLRHHSSGTFSSRSVECRVQRSACNATKRKSIVPAKSTAPSAKGNPTCTYAPTGYTIAPIAAKLVTSP